MVGVWGIKLFQTTAGVKKFLSLTGELGRVYDIKKTRGETISTYEQILKFNVNKIEVTLCHHIYVL